MPQSHPTIITGPRDTTANVDPNAPRPNVPHAGMERVLSALSVPKGPEKRHERERIYHSRIQNLRLQLTNPQDRVDPGTGLLIRGVPIFAQFRNGEFRISPDDRRFEPGEPWELFPFEKMVRRLESFKSFGPGGDFWDAEIRALEQTEAAVENVVTQAAANPEMARAVLSRLRDLSEAEGWALSSPPPPGSEKTKK